MSILFNIKNIVLNDKISRIQNSCAVCQKDIWGRSFKHPIHSHMKVHEKCLDITNREINESRRKVFDLVEKAKERVRLLNK